MFLKQTRKEAIGAELTPEMYGKILDWNYSCLLEKLQKHPVISQLASFFWEGGEIIPKIYVKADASTNFLIWKMSSRFFP